MAHCKDISNTSIHHSGSTNDRTTTSRADGVEDNDTRVKSVLPKTKCARTVLNTDIWPKCADLVKVEAHVVRITRMQPASRPSPMTSRTTVMLLTKNTSLASRATSKPHMSTSNLQMRAFLFLLTLAHL
ncbi:hypothetical protein ACOMHN_057429 [Nucella lapillus]